jgi:hypothetical protein
MKYRLLFLAVVLLASCAPLCAQSDVSRISATPLRNGDVLRLHQAGVKPGEIISRIVTSHCNFDTFPPVLRELKMKGLPDTVIMAMVMVPYGPPTSSREALMLEDPAPKTTRVQIPAGTIVEVETASPISSAEAGQGDRLIFRAARGVMVNGALVIERGAVARAHVVESRPAGAWGRAGSLAWVLDDVLAVDGSKIPIKLSDRLEGKNRSKAVVAAAIATGAVVFPYSPPVGLIWALKKGDEAVLDLTRKSIAVVTNNTEVAGVIPAARKVIYHGVEQLKANEAASGPGLPPMNQSFHASGMGRP